MKMRLRIILTVSLASLLQAQAGQANNIGENIAWQFMTPSDRAALMYLEEVRQRGVNGFYSAPIYNTYINEQYNCAVNSTATGNNSASSAVGNSPTAGGHNSTATGNESDTTFTGGRLSEDGAASTTQGNSGDINSRVSGAIASSSRGDNFQALNTDQVNSGSQTATVNGSTACNYATPAG